MNRSEWIADDGGPTMLGFGLYATAAFSFAILGALSATEAASHTATGFRPFIRLRSFPSRWRPSSPSIGRFRLGTPPGG